MADQDLSKLKVAELRDALKAKGLNTTGNKQELIDRLQAATEHPELDPKLEDELLKDDDIDDDDKSLLDSTHDLLKSPEGSSKSSTPEQPTPAKKVSLKRNTSIPIPVIEKPEEAEEKPSITSSDSSGEPEKKVVKLTQLSSQERLELRAKKFAGSANESSVASATINSGSQEKLTARAARFGITGPTSTTITAPTTVSDEVLKKRAERFGAISMEVKKVELNEKLQKRKERFGVALTPTAAADQAEKAKLRLERFKTSA